jgi:hypothetical protein
VKRGWLGVCSASLASALGCGSESPEPVSEPPLELPAEGWSSAAVAEDPFVEFSEGRVRCSPFAFRLEASWLEVTTTDCNYATLVYRFPREVAVGDVIVGEVAWATLASVEPAIGTLAFATLRDGVLWTHEVSIPGEADIVEVEFMLGQPAPAGSALYFHVRNHGYNAWQLSPLVLTDPPS